MSKMNEKNIKISSYITIITSIFLQKKKQLFQKFSKDIELYYFNQYYIISTNLKSIANLILNQKLSLYNYNINP